MSPQRFRYSGYLRPITYIFDIGVFSLFSLQFGFDIKFGVFVLFHILAWIILAYKLGFYEVYRFTKVVRILISYSSTSCFVFTCGFFLLSAFLHR